MFNGTEPLFTLVTVIHATCPTNRTRKMASLQRRAMRTVTSRDLDTITIVILVSIFAVFATLGALGNAFTCYVVARRRRMRTPLNLLVANLALSDVMLCVITQPFNIAKFSRLQWILSDAMCKAVPLFAGINVFVSTITICVIGTTIYDTKEV
jgi:divalent metal cation (Fe/Co/Zn/Cd) transporter